MKVTLDVPEGLAKVLAVDALIAGVSIEEVCLEYIKDQVEAHLDTEFYDEWIADVYKGKKKKQVAAR